MNRILEFFRVQLERKKSRELRRKQQAVCVDYVKVLSMVAIKNGNLKAVKYIPELMELGEKSIRWLLSDKRLKANCGTLFYYEMLFQLSFRTGVLVAEKWYADFDNLTYEYVIGKLKSDFMDYTTPLMRDVLKLEMDTGRHGPSLLLDDMYELWSTKIDPDSNFDNKSEDYIVASLLAVYVIAASMMFEKYGYQLKDYSQPEW